MPMSCRAARPHHHPSQPGGEAFVGRVGHCSLGGEAFVRRVGRPGARFCREGDLSSFRIRLFSEKA